MQTERPVVVEDLGVLGERSLHGCGLANAGVTKQREAGRAIWHYETLR
jgi:hypothetical protein